VTCEKRSKRTLREGLFYRLNVIRVDVPPRAERREDPPLVDF
jgi:DNA-binding NtrC family response regulator